MAFVDPAVTVNSDVSIDMRASTVDATVVDLPFVS